jgi:hypothetical protein
MVPGSNPGGPTINNPNETPSKHRVRRGFALPERSGSITLFWSPLPLFSLRNCHQNCHQTFSVLYGLSVEAEALVVLLALRA